MNRILVGTAGWNNPPTLRGKRQGAQSHLAYYAQHFDCVEINSSFYRSHRRETYQRWRDSTPARFRFSVKMPRAVTHECALRHARLETSRFFAEIEGLQSKLKVILIQLPPGLEFEARMVRMFFRSLPRLPGTCIVCEPRHMSWFSKGADAVLRRAGITRAAVDPARIDAAARPGADRQFAYFRWHGSPKMYYSSYGPDQLTLFAAAVRGCESRESWCVFDNTARYAAWDNALSFERALKMKRRSPKGGPA